MAKYAIISLKDSLLGTIESPQQDFLYAKKMEKGEKCDERMF